MTTNYTATVDITTPSVVLTDFTAVVPGSSGVNVYGGATNADINTFDIGPTGDSNIFLQTLAAGGHHVHGGVCHDSAHGTVPPYGVHGIYDKAAGTLVESMEFYEHPNGYGYSPRYSNSCYQSVFHDTPNCIGLFNYQGATTGAGGALRIRECVFYDLPTDGIVFYSDGVWRAADGTILGDSLISVELDHLTIDARGCTQPFPFQDCHNDVYLTNCVVISDAGLPLSSLVTNPSDGSPVHLDGSIVLDSADAATYLGPSPAFTPVAVGGSPVIGTAVASPPGVFAEWGNAGDLGATQTGSTPPGPPPLPGPSIPGLVLTKVGSAITTATDTIIIPITGDVPESDPALGATILFLFPLLPNGYTGSATEVSDDAVPGSGEVSCVFEDGANHYQTSFTGSTPIGLIVNALDTSNSLTVVFSDVAAFIACNVYAITGVNLPVSSVAIPPIFLAVNVFQSAEAPVGGGSGSSNGPVGEWIGGGGSLEFIAPFGATDEGWDWVTGQLALYFVFDNTATADELGWTWTDGAITDFDQFDYDGGDGFFYSMALGTAVVTPGAAAPSLDGNWGSGASKFFSTVIGHAFLAGPGPFCVTPPPSGGPPIFNNHIRLSE